MNDHHENINGPGATHNFIGGADGRSAPRHHRASCAPAAHHGVGRHSPGPEGKRLWLLEE